MATGTRIGLREELWRCDLFGGALDFDTNSVFCWLSSVLHCTSRHKVHPSSETRGVPGV